ncbi:hypothetical protein BDQ12DRAFT_727147 [Crucibulum laeve]|uniref:Uncharacterized protein n=1 Tax=Crucibulum laeve TaxID=68775 RepID=A0A5C3LLQ8_9AGAR|nr:hypothetical protein BDQ12DRAFT_727147 [Crucibulum laeve]
MSLKATLYRGFSGIKRFACRLTAGRKIYYNDERTSLHQPRQGDLCEFLIDPFSEVEENFPGGSHDSERREYASAKSSQTLVDHSRQLSAQYELGASTVLPPYMENVEQEVPPHNLTSTYVFAPSPEGLELQGLSSKSPAILGFIDWVSQEEPIEVDTLPLQSLLTVPANNYSTTSLISLSRQSIVAKDRASVPLWELLTEPSYTDYYTPSVLTAAKEFGMEDMRSAIEDIGIMARVFLTGDTMDIYIDSDLSVIDKFSNELLRSLMKGFVMGQLNEYIRMKDHFENDIIERIVGAAIAVAKNLCFLLEMRMEQVYCRFINQLDQGARDLVSSTTLEDVGSSDPAKRHRVISAVLDAYSRVIPDAEPSTLEEREKIIVFLIGGQKAVMHRHDVDKSILAGKWPWIIHEHVDTTGMPCIPFFSSILIEIGETYATGGPLSMRTAMIHLLSRYPPGLGVFLGKVNYRGHKIPAIPWISMAKCWYILHKRMVIRTSLYLHQAVYNEGSITPMQFPLEAYKQAYIQLTTICSRSVSAHGQDPVVEGSCENHITDELLKTLTWS